MFKEYLDDVDPAVVASLPPRAALAYHLISQGRTAEFVAAHEQQLRVPKPTVIRRGLRLYVDLPYLGDESVGVPTGSTT